MRGISPSWLLFFLHLCLGVNSSSIRHPPDDIVGDVTHHHSAANVKILTAPSYSDLEKTFICDMISATNIETVTNWNCNSSTPTTKCAYAGVACSSSKIITKFDLTSKSIIGTIPSSLTSLTALTMIKFATNSFSGTIPANMTKLSILRILNLGENRLIGNIPALPTTLSQLLISENSLVGTIPSSLVSLSLLTYLQVSSNRLTGSLPSGLENLSLLATLTLTGNSLNGPIPSAIGSFSRLSILYLNRNSFTGTVPDSFSSLTNLEILQIQYTSVQAIFPPVLCSFAKLTKFVITQDPQCITRSPSVLPTIMPSAPTTDPTILPSAVPTSKPTSPPSLSPSIKPSPSPSLNPTLVPSSVPTLVPSAVPSADPTLLPSADPSSAPSVDPTSIPSRYPSIAPSVEPTLIPSVDPTLAPSVDPTSFPSSDPSFSPTLTPSADPSSAPSVEPTLLPSTNPSFDPTLSPSSDPTFAPSVEPTLTPSAVPSSDPTLLPSADPSFAPSVDPTIIPSSDPSFSPTFVPSSDPSFAPSVEPTLHPTANPSSVPTFVPSSAPTVTPSADPTSSPSVEPTLIPSAVPSFAPTFVPSSDPTFAPSVDPSSSPSVDPTIIPSSDPSFSPTFVPSSDPSFAPSVEPTLHPTANPSSVPTFVPSSAPTVTPSADPTSSPSVDPSSTPSAVPSFAPTSTPTSNPTLLPSADPSFAPTVDPTIIPSSDPSFAPSVEPTLLPSANSSFAPTFVPSSAPSVEPTFPPSAVPSFAPTSTPTLLPSSDPSFAPSVEPTLHPTANPSSVPTFVPSSAPTLTPSTVSSSDPTLLPTLTPSADPTLIPSLNPSFSPSVDPTSTPSTDPSSSPSLTPPPNPSSAPSSFPSFLPSHVPTPGSSSHPSFVPSSDPSLAPTSYPSVAPTFHPTSIPTNLEELKQDLLDSTTTLNDQNCSKAPDCAALFRENCDVTANTCGLCLTGFYGESGDANSPCIDSTAYAEVVKNTANTACTLNSDCASWEVCDPLGRHCITSPKVCPNSCLGFGECTFVNTLTKLPLLQCNIFDASCDAICNCNEGYFGDSCQFTATELTERQQLRSTSLQILSQIVDTETPTLESVTSWQDMLQSITMTPDELPPSSQTVIIDLASTILLQLNVYPSLDNLVTPLLTAVDAGIQTIFNPNLSNTTSSESLNFEDFFNFLDKYNAYQSTKINSGQETISFIQSHFRVASTVLAQDSSMKITTPMTPEEELLSNFPTSTCALSNFSSLTNSHGITMTTLDSSYYRDSDNFTSVPMRIAVTNMSSSESLVLDFLLQNVESQHYWNLSSNVVLNTTCVIGEYSQHHLYCPGGPGVDILVIHTCFGNVSQVTTRCPNISRQPSCSVLGGTNFNCTLNSFDSKSTNCTCQKTTSTRKLSSSATSVVNDVWEASGALEIVSASVIVVEQFASTMSTADDLDSINDLNRAIIVILLYGILWSTGLFAITMFTFNQYRAKSASLLGNKKKSIGSPVPTSSLDQGREFLTKYVTEAFPAVFQQKPAWKRLWGEINRHHRYLLLFIPINHYNTSVQSLTVIHLLTVQSMLMFIMALCYDLQFPQYNETCSTHNDKISCLDEKSLFDESQSTCQWVWVENSVSSNTTLDGTMACKYFEQSSDYNIHAFIVISVVVAMFTSPVNLIVDFLFLDILSAPTADSLKLEKKDTAMKKISRRVSAVGSNVANASRRVGRRISQASVEAMATFNKEKNHRSTLHIPESTMDAHINASVTTHHLVEAVRKHNETLSERRKTERSQSIAFKKHINLVHRRSFEKSSVDGEGLRPGSATALGVETGVGHHREISTSITDVDVNLQHSSKVSPDNPNDSSQSTSKTIEDLFNEFSVDMVEQRKLLSRTEQEYFDDQWGIDPTGEFFKKQQNFLLTSRQIRAEDLIKAELLAVQTEAEKKFQKLRFATDMHIGLELLHLFILDLLGRNSPVAKIFVTKSEQDFRHAMIVTPTAKYIAWIAVILLNFFFVFFSILRGLQRGLAWQRLYMMACIFQILVEVLFYETSECAIVHFVIPDLARDEVRKASLTIKKAVQQICSKDFQPSSIPILLDAPRYFYLSTNVSFKFPALLESVLIQSYHTYYPSETPWSQGSSSSSSSSSSSWWWMSNTPNRVGKSLLTSTLQYLGASSPTIQRVVIHLIQPLFVSSVVYLWISLYQRPVWFALVGLVILLCVARHYYINRHYNSHQLNENEVHPVSSLPEKESNHQYENNPTHVSDHLDQHILPSKSKDLNKNIEDMYEEKSDGQYDSPYEIEKMSVDERSLGPPEGSSIVSAGQVSSQNYEDEDPSFSSEKKVIHYPAPLRRKQSDYSLSGSAVSSVDSPMEFSDPDDYSCDSPDFRDSSDSRNSSPSLSST